jgi:hypothetical protein
MVPKLVGHLDADCFYVSAERVRFPFLLGKPVGVLGNQGACVIAKSYEMKAAGVATGKPIWDTRQKCPEGVYLKRDFRWYEVLSRKMLAAMRDLSPAVEYYSIDEVFFSAQPAPGQCLQALAETLRNRLSGLVGVPVTVGIARSKALARLVSESSCSRVKGDKRIDKLAFERHFPCVEGRGQCTHRRGDYSWRSCSRRPPSPASVNGTRSTSASGSRASAEPGKTGTLDQGTWHKLQEPSEDCPTEKITILAAFGICSTPAGRRRAKPWTFESASSW